MGLLLLCYDLLLFPRIVQSEHSTTEHTMYWHFYMLHTDPMVSGSFSLFLYHLFSQKSKVYRCNVFSYYHSFLAFFSLLRSGSHALLVCSFLSAFPSYLPLSVNSSWADPVNTRECPESSSVNDTKSKPASMEQFRDTAKPAMT